MFSTSLWLNLQILKAISRNIMDSGIRNFIFYSIPYCIQGVKMHAVSVTNKSMDSN